MPIDAELLQVVDISFFDIVALVVVFVFVLISTISLIAEVLGLRFLLLLWWSDCLLACVLSGRAASGCIAMAASYLSVAFARFFSIVASSSDVLGGVDISDVAENAPPTLHWL